MFNLIKFIFKSTSNFFFIKPLQLFYQAISEIRNILYNLKFKKIVKLNIPVISVGNLTFGGTGKTPFIQFLAHEIVNEKKIILVCKSYKVDLKKPSLVDLKLKNAAEKFGDEACLLQKKLPHVDVWSGPHKAKTAFAAANEFIYQQQQQNNLQQQQPIDQSRKPILIVDDGFSHRALFREYNIVLFDATKLEKDYLREFFKNIIRADAIIITKIKNLQSELTSEIQIFKEKIVRWAPHLKDNIYLSSEKFFIPFDATYPLYAFCGLAKSENFKKSLIAMGYKVSFFENFDDHQNYDSKLQKEIVNRFKKQKELEPRLILVTTEKDAIKMTNEELQKNIHVIQYSLTMSESDIKKLKESLLEKIRTYS